MSLHSHTPSSAKKPPHTPTAFTSQRLQKHKSTSGAGKKTNIPPPLQFATLVPLLSPDDAIGTSTGASMDHSITTNPPSKSSSTSTTPTTSTTLHLFGGLTTSEHSAQFHTESYLYHTNVANRVLLNQKSTTTNKSTKKTPSKRVHSTSTAADNNKRRRNATPFKKLPQTHPSLQKRAFHAMVSRSDGSQLLFGGSNGASLLSDVWLFEMEGLHNHQQMPSAPASTSSSGSWKGPISVKNPIQGLMSHSMVYCHNLDSALVFGGETETGKTNHLHILHCRDEWKWELIALPSEGASTSAQRHRQQQHAPSPRSAHCAQLWNNESMIVFGGDIEGDMQSNELWIFSLKTHSWRKVQPKGDIPSPRSCASSALWRDQFFVFGGFPYSNDFFSFDLRSETWRRIHIHGSMLPSPRSGMAMTLSTEREVLHQGPVAKRRTITYLHPKIYIFGGRSYDRGDIFDTNDLYKIHFPHSMSERVEGDAIQKQGSSSKTTTEAPQLKSPASRKKMRKQKRDTTSTRSESTVSSKQHHHQTTIHTDDDDDDDYSSLQDDTSSQDTAPPSSSRHHRNGAKKLPASASKQSSVEPDIINGSVAQNSSSNHPTSPQHSKALEIMHEAQLETIKSNYEIKLSESAVHYQSLIDEQASVIDDLTQQYQSAQKTIHSLKEEVNKEQEKRHLLAETTKRQLEEETQVTSESLRDMKTRCKKSEEKQAQLLEQIHHLESKVESLEAQLQEANKALEIAKKQIESEKYAHQTRVKLHESQLDEHTEKAQQELERITEKYEDKISALQQEIEQLQIDMEQKAKVRTELYSKIMELENQQASHERSLNSTAKDYEKEIDRLQSVIQRKEDEEEEVSLRFQDLRELLDVREEELDTLQQRYNEEKDAASELQSLVESLSEQLSKTKQEQDENVKELELRHAELELQHQEELKKMRLEASAHLNESEKLVFKISQLQEQSGESATERQNLLSQIEELSQKLEESETNQETGQQTLRERIRQLEDSVKEKTVTCTHLEENIAALHQTHANQMSQLVKDHRKEHRELLKEHESELKRKQQELTALEESHREERLSWQKERTKSIQHASSLEQQINSLKESMNKQQSTIESLQNTLEERKKNHEDAMQERLVEISKLRRLIVEMSDNDTLAEAQEEMHDLREELLQVKKKHGQAVHENQYLEERIQTLQEELQDLNRVIQSKEESNLNLTQRLHEQQQQLDTVERSASSVRLGEEQLRERQEQEFDTMLSELKSQHATEVSKLRQTIERQENKLRSLKHDMQNQIQLTKDENARLKLECKELRQQNLDTSSSSFSQVSSLKNNLAQCESRCLSLEQKVSSLQETLQLLRTENQQLQDRNSTLEESNHKLQNDRVRLHESNSKISQELNAAVDLMNDSKSTVKDKYENKIRKLKSELKESQETCEALEEVVQQLSRRVTTTSHLNDTTASESADWKDSSGTIPLNKSSRRLHTAQTLSALELNSAIRNYEDSLSSKKDFNKSLSSKRNSREGFGQEQEQEAPRLSHSMRSQSASTLHNSSTLLDTVERQTKEEREGKDHLDERIAELKNSLSMYKNRLSKSKLTSSQSQHSFYASSSLLNEHTQATAPLLECSKSITQSVQNLVTQQEVLEKKFVVPLREKNVLSVMRWTRIFNHFDTVYESCKYVSDRLAQCNSDGISTSTEADEWSDALSHVEDSLPLLESYSRHYHRYGSKTLSEISSSHDAFLSHVKSMNSSVDEVRNLILAPIGFVSTLRESMEEWIQKLDSESNGADGGIYSSLKERLLRLYSVVQESQQRMESTLST